MQGTAADVLTPTGAVVPATALVDEAEQRLVTLGASELYVVGPDGPLAGILPDYDLLKRRIAGDNRPQCVADMMSGIDVRASCVTPLRELALHLRQSCRARIPVVAKGRLVGEVTRPNLLRHLRAEGVSSGNVVVETTLAAEARQIPPGAPKFLRSGAAPSSCGAGATAGIAITS
jgi:signal-transduction protein with cAMP-binding, CBS, and nucleotidyltransferase domain